MHSRLALAVFVLGLALACAAPATALNIATPRMAAVASWAAGKPITVWCESDEAEWRDLVAGTAS